MVLIWKREVGFLFNFIYSINLKAGKRKLMSKMKEQCRKDKNCKDVTMIMQKWKYKNRKEREQR